MAFDAHKNFAYSTVATPPAPAISGTSLVVQLGDGAKFPAVPFNVTIWPPGAQPSTGNAEIARVTAIAGDTFTITRTQEFSAARTVLAGDQVSATITAKVAQDLETQLLPLSGGTLTGDLKFVDGLYDIGKSGTTRPRDLFLSRNLSVSGLLTVAGFGSHGLIASGAGGLVLTLQNTGGGASNYTRLNIGNDSDPALLSVTTYSSTATVGPLNQPGSSLLYQTGLGGLFIGTSQAAPIRFITSTAERMRLASSGELLIGQTAVIPFGGALGISADGTLRSGLSLLNTNTGNTINYVTFLNSAGALAGSIQQTGATTVAYVTTSDARLKCDHGPATDLAGLRAVRVHDFTWRADARRDRGVFAQEAHAVFPRAIAVGTDAITPSGVLAQPWMTDYSRFVPDLIVGWQQHDARLRALEAAGRRVA